MTPPRFVRPIAVSLGLLMIAALVPAPRLYAGGDKDKPPVPTGKPGEGGPAPTSKPTDETDSLDDDAADGLPPEVVSKAIERGVNWLKGRQLPDGSWGLIEGNAKYDPKETGQAYKHPAGSTALSLYALLKCGVPTDDSVVKKGFKFLKDKHRLPGGSYETSAMLLAVTATADPFKRYKASVAAADRVKLSGEFRQWALDLHGLLLKKRKALGWRYNHGGGGEPSGGDQDLSSTQLASLALFAADRCGIKTDSKIWGDTLTFALAQQEDDGPEVDRAVAGDKDKGRTPKRGDGAEDPAGRYGPQTPDKPVKDKARGFAYIKSETLRPDEGQATGGMTACGLGTILFGRHVLFNRLADKTWEKQDQKAVQQSIYDGLAWLSMNFSASTNPKKQSMNIYPLYYLYCVERAMDLVGVWKLGKHMWYIEMGQFLLSRQKQQGFWDADGTHKPSDVLNTCFALLFLKRATKGGIPFPSLTPSADEAGVDGRGNTDDDDEK